MFVIAKSGPFLSRHQSQSREIGVTVLRRDGGRKLDTITLVIT